MRRFLNRVLGFIGQKSPIQICTPRAGSYGNCAEDIFFGILKAKREDKKVLFVHPRNIFSRKLVANQSLFYLDSASCVQSRTASFIGAWILTGLFLIMWVLRPVFRIRWVTAIMRSIWREYDRSEFVAFYSVMMPKFGRATFWKPKDVDHFSWDTVNEIGWERQYDEYPPPRLSGKNLRHAEQLRAQMGISADDWFVCLHVREGGFHRDSLQIRNASIENYAEGIKVITAAGGWVVRIGDSSMSHLPKTDRVIDYPHSGFKSELMDLYLISNCRLFIGTNPGPSDVATLFKKPMVLVNVSDWGNSFPIKNGDLAISKHIFSRPLNRYLSVKEILEETYLSHGFKTLPKDYVTVENTSEEIREVIEEALAQLEDHNYSDLQKNFNEGRNHQIRRLLHRSEKYFAIWSFRMASRADAAVGTCGHRYLEQNWLTDDLEWPLLTLPVSAAD